MSRKKQLEAKLDPRKRHAALLLVERDLTDDLGGERKTMDEIAAEVGVSRQAIHNWNTQDRNFIEYKNLLADDFLDAKRSLVYRQLMKLIEGPQPSVKAIDLFMRRHGLLTDRSIVETKEISGGRSNEDIAKELDELDELLAEASDDNEK